MTPENMLEVLLQRLATRTRHRSRDQIVRLAVRLRAREACEYCLLPGGSRFEIDHSIPSARWDEYVADRIARVEPLIGRAGPHHIDNYAWSCTWCNSAKSEQVSGRVGRRPVRLFDPRQDRWAEHFGFVHSSLLIVGLSHIGEVTVRALRMNDSRIEGPVGARHEAILQGRYPPPWVRTSFSDAPA